MYYENWKYTPVNDKKPFIDDWQNKPMNWVDAWKHPMKNGVTSNGIGLVLGEQSGGVLAIDFDGQEAWDHFANEVGSLDALDLSVSWTSGKEERLQVAYTVPKDAWALVKTMKVSPHKKLEFRWNGHQSVLPPSIHPETGKYEWISQGELKEIPYFILEYWINKLTPKQLTPTQTIKPIPEDKVEEYILGLMDLIKSSNYSLSYDDWIKVAFAIAKEVGSSCAKIIMQHYYPESKKGEYGWVFTNSYDISKSPGIGALYNMAKSVDPIAAKELWKKANLSDAELMKLKIVELTKKIREDRLLGAK